MDCECLWLGDANRDTIALKGHGEVDCVYIGANDGEEIRFRRGDVDFAGWRAIGDGDRVKVWNERGSIVVVAHVNRDLREGLCVLPKGVWLRDFDGDVGVNSLVPDSLSDLADGACFNDARVEVVSVV